MLAHKIYGNKNKSIIFLHGNSSSKESFEELAQSLSSEHTCLIIDLPGHGNSRPLPKSQEYSITNITELIATTITSLDLKSVILVGHSFGGHLCISLAEKITDKVESIHIINASPSNSLDELAKAFNPIEASSYIFKNQLSNHQMQELVNLYTDDKERRLESLKKTDLRFRESLFNSLALNPQLNEVNRLKKLKKPVSLIFSDNDQLLNIDYIKELYENDTFYNVHFLKGANHFPQGTHTEQISNIIKS